MKTLLLIPLFVISIGAFSQDTLDDVRINPSWVNPEKKLDVLKKDTVLESNIITDMIDKIVPNWVKPEKIFEEPKEELTQEDVKLLEEDVKFMADLPPSYEELPKENLKTVLIQIDNKIAQLKQEIDKLIKERAKQELIKSKQGTLTVLEKEKSIINLTLTEGELKDENGNLVGQNDELKVEQNKLKRYLYIAFGIITALGLVTAVVLQRKKIQVQDVEIEEQIRDINKKNTYLDHAARLIRHDMHSGINTYMPRGITSLERRVDEEKMKELKIDGAIKMIKEGLAHTQKVYKNVYEFTNLVKENVVLEKKEVNLKDELLKYFSNTSYGSQVTVEDLGTENVNPILFCSGIDNLVRNGLKYNDSAEKAVKIYRTDNIICVEDNGRGLSPKEFQKVLEHKIDTQNAVDGGEGLGLNITNAIFVEHGYRLDCEKLPKGTKMKISIQND
jgi:signal transduction histidine kinase